MSRGPGRLQRAILEVLTQDEWSTTIDVCQAIADSWPMDNPRRPSDSTIYRQAHRALDRLSDVGLVEKSWAIVRPDWDYDLRLWRRAANDDEAAEPSRVRGPRSRPANVMHRR